MKKEVLILVKSVVEGAAIKSANTMSSIFAHQSSEPNFCCFIRMKII